MNISRGRCGGHTQGSRSKSYIATNSRLLPRDGSPGEGERLLMGVAGAEFKLIMIERLRRAWPVVFVRFRSTYVTSGMCPVSQSYGVDVPFMSFYVHGWDIHAV